MKIAIKTLFTSEPVIEVKEGGMLGDLHELQKQLELGKVRHYVVWNYKGMEACISVVHLLNAIRLANDYSRAKDLYRDKAPILKLYWQMTEPIPDSIRSLLPKISHQ